MRERQSRLGKRAQTKRQLVAQVMAEIDMRKLTTDDMTISQGYTRPSVVITGDLAPEFVREKIIREPDKTKIKQCIDDGMTVAGAELSNPQPMLTVRTK